ncbi:MAG: hypothetical protein AB7D33_14070 [Sphingobium sp.]
MIDHRWDFPDYSAGNEKMVKPPAMLSIPSVYRYAIAKMQRLELTNCWIVYPGKQAPKKATPERRPYLVRTDTC